MCFRDEYVEVKPHNIKGKMLKNFVINSDVLPEQMADPFDWDSIMLYGPLDGSLGFDKAMVPLPPYAGGREIRSTRCMGSSSFNA